MKPAGSTSAALRFGLGVVLLAWCAAVLIYGLRTPTWQAPDEPAHFNYVVAIVEGRLPVLDTGSWDPLAQARIIDSPFDAALPIDTIAYEAHQPPAHYVLLAAPLALLLDGGLEARVEVLRVVSGLLGLPLLALVWQIARRSVGRGWLALSAVAFVALLPQHVAIAASVNNDIMGELAAAALVTWAVVVVTRQGALNAAERNRLLAIAVVLTGWVLLAKSTAYTSLALIPLALLLARQRLGWSWPRSLAVAAAIGAAGLALALPWFGRNLIEYGVPDVLGQVRHDLVVVGQPVGRLDSADGWQQVLTIGFRSFFAQLGWMAWPAPDRIYWLLLGLLALSLAGVVRRLARPGPLAPAGWILAASIALVTTAALYYNVRFFQPQGRYLFGALPAIAVALTWGAAAWLPTRWRLVGPAAWLAALLWLSIIAVTDLIPRLPGAA